MTDWGVFWKNLQPGNNLETDFPHSGGSEYGIRLLLWNGGGRTGGFGKVIDEHNTIPRFTRTQMFQCIVYLRHGEEFYNRCNGVTGAKRKHTVHRRRAANR